MGLFAQNLNGSVSIGDALSEAKQLYAAQSGVLDPYDLKADMESTYYGMPNYTLSGLAKPVANSAAATTPLSLGQDPATGLQTASISLSQSVGTNPNQLGTVTPPEGGTYYEVNNSTLEQTRAGFPIEPLSSIDVTNPGANGGLASVAHGALITALTSTDRGDSRRPSPRRTATAPGRRTRSPSTRPRSRPRSSEWRPTNSSTLPAHP